jgi:hypothetical protein
MHGRGRSRCAADKKKKKKNRHVQKQLWAHTQAHHLLHPARRADSSVRACDAALGTFGRVPSPRPPPPRVTFEPPTSPAPLPAPSSSRWPASEAGWLMSHGKESELTCTARRHKTFACKRSASGHTGQGLQCQSPPRAQLFGRPEHHCAGSVFSAKLTKLAWRRATSHRCWLPGSTAFILSIRIPQPELQPNTNPHALGGLPSSWCVWATQWYLSLDVSCDH